MSMAHPKVKVFVCFRFSLQQQLHDSTGFLFCSLPRLFYRVQLKKPNNNKIEYNHMFMLNPKYAKYVCMSSFHYSQQIPLAEKHAATNVHRCCSPVVENSFVYNSKYFVDVRSTGRLLEPITFQLFPSSLFLPPMTFSVFKVSLFIAWNPRYLVVAILHTQGPANPEVHKVEHVESLPSPFVPNPSMLSFAFLLEIQLKRRHMIDACFVRYVGWFLGILRGGASRVKPIALATLPALQVWKIYRQGSRP